VRNPFKRKRTRFPDGIPRAVAPVAFSDDFNRNSYGSLWDIPDNLFDPSDWLDDIDPQPTT
jgi:hypothetical protein